MRTRCQFEDDSGNVIVWWASTTVDWLQEGDTVDITATIKKHDDFKGTPQTVLTRVRQGLTVTKKRRKSSEEKED